MEVQLYQILHQLLNKQGIVTDTEELRLQLLSHPSYPSLHSVTGVLDHFGIPNAALKLPVTAEVYAELPKSFITNIKRAHFESLVLVELQRDHVKITHNRKRTEKISREQFLNQWTGLVLMVEKDETLPERKDRSQPKHIPVIPGALGLLSLGYFILSMAQGFPIAHFLLSCFGIILSIFVIKHELGFHSAFISNLCQTSENSSCDAVLQSNKALLFGIIKLSDLSLIIFSGYVISWLLFAIADLTNTWIFMTTSLLALPFTFYTIYHQLITIKKWCPLCLGITGILWLQAGSLSLVKTETLIFDLHPEALLVLPSSVLFIWAVWSFIKLLLQQKLNYRTLSIAHYKFKRNFSLFHTLYRKGNSLYTTDEIAGEIVFGNRQAPVSIILVTNPFCNHCRTAHHELESVLIRAKNKVKITLRFIVDTKNKERDLYKIVSQLLHIYKVRGEASCLHALNKLYADGTNISQWVKAQTTEFHSNYDSIIECQRLWCEENRINFTPALYIGDRPLPEEYAISDLPYFIDDLIEMPEKQHNITQRVATY
ncbi:MAG: vitamin K epoxide reductase family protein [Bacteroidota bacterium]